MTFHTGIIRNTKRDNYTSVSGVKSALLSIYSVSNNLTERGLVHEIEIIFNVQLTFGRHNKTPSFGCSPVDCLNNINQLDIFMFITVVSQRR